MNEEVRVFLERLVANLINGILVLFVLGWLALLTLASTKTLFGWP